MNRMPMAVNDSIRQIIVSLETLREEYAAVTAECAQALEARNVAIRQRDDAVAQLDQVRRALGVAPGSPVADTAGRTGETITTSGWRAASEPPPETVEDVIAETFGLPAPARASAAPVGEPVTRPCDLCSTPFVVRSNRQRVCAGCRPKLDDHNVSVNHLKAPAPKPCAVCSEEFTPKTPAIRVCDACRTTTRPCRNCGEIFTPRKQRGPAPLYCDTCKRKRDRAERAQQGQDVPALPIASPKPPERRCGRCCHMFQPAFLGDYYCVECRQARTGKQPLRLPTEPELESTGWNGRGSITDPR